MYRGFLFYELVVNVSSRENKETSNNLNKNTLVIFQETLRSTDPLPHLLRALLNSLFDQLQAKTVRGNVD